MNSIFWEDALHRTLTKNKRQEEIWEASPDSRKRPLIPPDSPDSLPPYSPELNPQEHVWDELREKEFPNRVFNELAAVVRQLEQGLPRMSADGAGLRSLTAWPWIVSLNLNAN